MDWQELKMGLFVRLKRPAMLPWIFPGAHNPASPRPSLDRP